MDGLCMFTCSLSMYLSSVRVPLSRYICVFGDEDWVFSPSILDTGPAAVVILGIGIGTTV